ncbi:Glutamate--cysteine ligase regulatory subunit [Folsomia candida]|uniref:GCS light chain n=1 Tax=Folsomia candida TaxID=158441 RepID=A0A226EMA1_FOLCA|nr:Glutamate--cysteine ligase regulatory subunit [Folsomia candida]
MDTACGQSIILSSGNILTKSIAWKNGSDAANEEVYESLKSCFDGPSKIIQTGDVYEVFGDDIKNVNGDSERQDLKISLKIFLYSPEKGDLASSIEKGLRLTSSETLDTLVVTFSGHMEGIPISLDIVKSAWLILEDMVRNGKVKVIGLSDVDTQLFIQLHDWAQIKPGIIQINLASCCVVPPELADFCKKEGIQLLTHSDPINALSQEKINMLIEALASHDTFKSESSSVHWDLKWVVRYQVHLKSRGVVATKGYSAAINKQCFK